MLKNLNMFFNGSVCSVGAATVEDLHQLFVCSVVCSFVLLIPCRSLMTLRTDILQAGIYKVHAFYDQWT